MRKNISLLLIFGVVVVGSTFFTKAAFAQTTSNRAPSFVNGPSSLYIGEPGTWTVNAYDPDGNLSSLSVQWGDGISSTISISGASTTKQLIKTYTTGGAKTIRFTVRDSNGLSITTSWRVIIKKPLVSSSTLVVTNLPEPTSQNVAQGTSQFEFARIMFFASTTESVKIKGLKIGDVTDGWITDISNIKVMDGATVIASAAQFDSCSDAYCTRTWSSSDSLFTIPAGASKTLSIKADISPQATLLKHRFAVGLFTDVKAVGETTGNVITSIVSGAGQTMFVVPAGSDISPMLRVTKMDASTNDFTTNGIIDWGVNGQLVGSCGHGVCSYASSTFTSGTSILIRAFYNNGTVVNGTVVKWGQDCESSATSTGISYCPLTMNGNKRVSAYFLSNVPTSTILTVNISGTGQGIVQSNPYGIMISYPFSSSSAYPYASGTIVTVSAYPTSTSVFGGWTGCDSVINNGSGCVVTMSYDRTISGSFNLPQGKTGPKTNEMLSSELLSILEAQINDLRRQIEALLVR